MVRASNNPKRRIATPAHMTEAERSELADRLRYTGSALHKTKPGDYGFHPPINPRPSKSICDGHRVVLIDEARTLFRNGVLLGMFSEPAEKDNPPKYVWSVDAEGFAYEAKIDRDGYHGYCLEPTDPFRDVVVREWKRRCQEN